MSKIIERLNRLSQGTPQPIGFRALQAESPRPKIQVVASLAQEDAEGLIDFVAGADAGLLCISKLKSAAEVLKKLTQAMPDFPWGVRLPEGQTEVKSLTQSGCDFVIFSAANTPLTIFDNDRVGKILEIETSITESLLRATNRLPIDGVLFAREGKPNFLTWQHLMLFQRSADLLTKPMLVAVPAKLTAGELQALWEAGADGVVIEVTAGQSRDMLKELRKVINEMTFPLPRRREKPSPLLPRIAEVSTVTKDEDDEDDEEEEEEERRLCLC
jgi:hypothetical protein